MTRPPFSFTAILFGLVVFAGVLGCTKKEPIQIGFIAGLSGRVADLGVPGRNGAMLAVEQINVAGGIHGRPVTLLARDDQQNTETAQNAVAELLSQKVQVIIGPMTSNMAIAVLPVINTSPAILVSPTVATTDLSGKDDHFIRVIGVTTDYAQRNARYQVEKLGLLKTAVIYDRNNAAYSESWLRDFRKTLEGLGGTIVRMRPYRSSDETVFLEMVMDLLSSKPDNLLIIANAVDAALICQQVRKVAPKLPITMSEWASTERFIELAGKASENVYVSQFLNRDDTSERYLKFRTAYMRRFGQEPGFAGVAGYDAASVVLEAMARQRMDQSLKNTIIGIGEFHCLQQWIKIDRFGDAERKNYLSVIHNGQYHTLE
ncbi:MAG: ABC transporter substrate-binding protein [Desulfobacteraceae bacterium]|nr:ABC transporter substrate-binding protein [Desulfobacteraceae bacterium]